jgi:NADH-quinone oxidoreductase subunit G
MEAAVRTAHFYATGKKLGRIELESIRGLAGVREGTLNIEGTELRVAVAHGLAHVETVLERVRQARREGRETPYHFIEVMACPGGCIGGGGQPYGVDDERRRQRMEGLYSDDRGRGLRYSHENPELQKLYAEFLGKPLGTKAHELLHTEYTARPLYRK